MSAKPSVELQEGLAAVEDLRQMLQRGMVVGSVAEHRLNRLEDILRHLLRLITETNDAGTDSSMAH